MLMARYGVLKEYIYQINLRKKRKDQEERRKNNYRFLLQSCLSLCLLLENNTGLLDVDYLETPKIMIFFFKAQVSTC